MKREEIEKLALSLARDLSALCRRKLDPYGAEEILRFAANSSSWREVRIPGYVNKVFR